MTIKDIVIDVEKSIVKIADEIPKKLSAIESKVYAILIGDIAKLEKRISALEAKGDGKTKTSRKA